MSTPCRLIMTRALPEAVQSAARLEALGLVIDIVPILEQELLKAGLPAAGEVTSIALTSQNALAGLKYNRALEDYLALPLFAVGEKSGRAALDAGFSMVEWSDGGVGALAHLIGQRQPGSAVFYPGAETVSGDLEALLTPFGCKVTRVPVYRMRGLEALPKDISTLLAAGVIDGALIYSQRAASIFAGLAGNADIEMLCLSETIGQVLLRAGYSRISLADFPSEEAMMALALSFARGQIR